MALWGPPGERDARLSVYSEVVTFPRQGHVIAKGLAFVSLPRVGALRWLGGVQPLAGQLLNQRHGNC